MTRLPLAALSLALLSLPTAARADVTLTLVPDASTATVLSPEGWLLTATGEGDLAPTLVLPGHGAGELAGDEPGDPIYGKNDADTKWVVTDAAGAMQTGRVLSWPVMSAPFSLHVSVLTPPLAAWFHAGAGASWSSTPVMGVAKGGQIDVQQSGVVNSGFIYADSYPRVMLEWDVDNTTNHDVSVTRERLGLPAGFTLVSSTLGDPEYRSSPHSFSAEWSDAVTIPPHSTVEWDVWLDAPCGQGKIHARLQVTEDSGERIGTGNKGPELQLQECGA